MNNPKPSTITHRQISDKRQDVNFDFFFIFLYTGNKGSVIDKNLKQKDKGFVLMNTKETKNNNPPRPIKQNLNPINGCYLLWENGANAKEYYEFNTPKAMFL